MINMPDRESEPKIKIKIGDWLETKGCTIYDERENKKRPKWGVFKVRGIEQARKPDSEF